jgi:hypothetical protein
MVDGNGSSQPDPSAGLAALRLAEQIRARYDQRMRRPPSVARHWLRLRPVVAALAQHQVTALAQRLHLTVVAHLLGRVPTPGTPALIVPAVPASLSPAAPAWQMRASTATVVRTTHTVVGREASSERLLQPIAWHVRQLQRWQPVERLVQQGQPVAAGLMGPAPRHRAVPRVLRRPIAAVAEPGSRQPASPAGARRERPGAYAREEAPLPPQINIGDVTNQVLQQLDLRLQAHRERHGRV